MLKNIISFNISWLGLVYIGNTFAPIALIFIIAHLLSLPKDEIKSQAILMLMITIIGCSVDFILHAIGFFIFTDSTLIPLWLVILWLAFSTTISSGLNFLSSSKLLQVIAGGIFAPLSYLAGEQFEAVTFGQGLTQTYIYLSAIWINLFLLFFYLKSKLIITEKEEVYD